MAPVAGFIQVVFLLCLLYLMCDLTSAQGLDAVSYLNRKEAIVKTIAGYASICAANCGSLNTCSSECSRGVCQPILGETFLCTTVDNNEYFGSCSAGACSNKFNLDYSRSFVTLPAPGSTDLATEVARDICLLRALDPTFKEVSLPSEYELVYFGSTSGAFRAFPGRDQDEFRCTRFDTRKRPWYLNGISVSKDVKILIDLANSMASVVTVDFKRSPQTTYLDVAINMTLELLQTFSPHDFVEVISFNSLSSTSLVGPVQIGTSYNYSYNADPASRTELIAMTASVKGLAASSVTSAPSNLEGAIVHAVNSLNTTNTLKVIIVLSDGHFAPFNSTTFPAVAMRTLQAKLMVYKLPTNDDSADPYLLKTPSFQEDICAVNGSFERLVAPDTANPLYAVRSYFTYLAHTQLNSVGNNATWSNPYSSFSQNRTAITVTYPAFGSDGLLIGVAGVDVITENLPQPLQDEVYAEFQSRNRGTQVAPANISLSCSYQSAAASAICPTSTVPDSSALCAQNDTSSLGDRVCCGYGSCGPTSGGMPKWSKILIGVLTATVTVIIAGLLYFRLRHLTGNDSKRNPGNDSNRNPGNDSNRNPGNDSNRNPGNDSNRNPGNDSNRNPGNDSNRNRGNDSNRNPGNDSNRNPGNDSNRNPGNDSNRNPGNDSNRNPGNDSNRNPGNDSNRNPGNDSNRNPGNDSNRNPGNDSNRNPGNDSDVHRGGNQPANRDGPN